MTSLQKDKQSNLKWTKEQILLQGGRTEGPETHEMMVSITNNQKCKYKPRLDTTSHRSEWPSLTNQQTTSAGEVVEKREP